MNKKHRTLIHALFQFVSGKTKLLAKYPIIPYNPPIVVSLRLHLHFGDKNDFCLKSHYV